ADYRRKLGLLQHARATLFPIDWEEPFGLVMIESMLCGTPVLAFPRGSVPEVVDDGITAHICRSVDDLTARLRLLGEPGAFDRARCREHAMTRFGRARMVGDYLGVYARAIALAGGRPHAAAHGALDGDGVMEPLEPMSSLEMI